MLKKILLVVIILLIPIYKISFQWKTNFILSKKGEKRITVNFNNKEYELDQYVYHVVLGEMPLSFEKEALKAQILATRTYTYNKIYNNKNYIFTLSDQAFKEDINLSKEQKELVQNLIKETKNEIITYNDKPIKSYYFSMSNGYTENVLNVFGSNEEYLKSVESNEENVRNFITEKRISIEDFKNKLNITNNIEINKIDYDESNRVNKITINNKEYTGIDIRKKLNLRSTDFDIKINNNEVMITTKGFGHGVGMSQYGANELAKQGYNYKEILKKYYTGTKISKI